AALNEPLADIPQLTRIAHRAMLQNPFPALERQVESAKLGVALFELVDYAQRLQVVLEPAIRAHAFVERLLAGMPERSMTEIVCEADSLRQRLVELQSQRRGARDLRYFDRVCDSRAVQVPLVIYEHLGLVDQAAEGVRVNDSVAVALKLGS